MFANPDKNIASLLLREGMRVADFGAGSGFLTRSLSQRVGHTGHVYAIEVQKNLVHRLESELKDLGLKNVSVIWGDIEHSGGTKIADGSMDAVVVSNVLFQASDKLGVIDEAKRILKRGGRVLLVESVGLVGESISPKKAQEIFESRGFTFVENIMGSSHHYGIIFRYQKE